MKTANHLQCSILTSQPQSQSFYEHTSMRIYSICSFVNTEHLTIKVLKKLTENALRSHLTPEEPRARLAWRAPPLTCGARQPGTALSRSPDTGEAGATAHGRRRPGVSFYLTSVSANHCAPRPEASARSLGQKPRRAPRDVRAQTRRTVPAEAVHPTYQENSLKRSLGDKKW